MTQNKKTQERLPNRRNEINTFSVFRLAFLRTWTSFIIHCFLSFFFAWFECLCVSGSVSMFGQCFLFDYLFVSIQLYCIEAKWTHRLGVFETVCHCCCWLCVRFFFLLFFGEIALSFILLCSSQFSPICAGWCLDDGNEAHTHSREEEKRDEVK